jgi:hypothetical protein
MRVSVRTDKQMAQYNISVLNCFKAIRTDRQTNLAKFTLAAAELGVKVKLGRPVLEAFPQTHTQILPN